MMPADLRTAMRDALAVSVPPAPTGAIRKRAQEISRRHVARALLEAAAIAVCSLCFWLTVASDASRNGAAGPTAIVTPAPRPAPGPAIS